jgi:hypothetical protein
MNRLYPVFAGGGAAVTEQWGNSASDFSPFLALKDVEGLVHQLLASWQQTTPLQQRRRWHRATYVKRILLTPLHDTTDEPIGETRRVTGRDLSLHGISFVHVQPLPYSKVALGLEMPDGISSPVVTRLKWCRFTKLGVYQSGGQFVRQLDPSLSGEDVSWDDVPPG